MLIFFLIILLSFALLLSHIRNKTKLFFVIFFTLFLSASLLFSLLNLGRNFTSTLTRNELIEDKNTDKKMTKRRHDIRKKTK